MNTCMQLVLGLTKPNLHGRTAYNSKDWTIGVNCWDNKHNPPWTQSKQVNGLGSLPAYFSTYPKLKWAIYFFKISVHLLWTNFFQSPTWTAKISSKTPLGHKLLNLPDTITWAFLPPGHNHFCCFCFCFPSPRNLRKFKK